ncbi:MAG: hypothetical protein HYY18_12400 [Planctomycetes bacterium]|nr:hypothetical protein [Planctomycetota bacterium]
MFPLRPLALALLASSAIADPVPRWKLDATPNPPERFTHEEGVYWVVSCELTNRGPEPAPLALQFTLYRKGESSLAGGFYPEVTDAFAAHTEGLDRLNPGVRGEALLRLRERGRWLTGSDLRKRRELRKDESLHTIAVFRDDGRTGRAFDVLVSGLSDPAVQRDRSLRDLSLSLRHENRLLRLRCESGSGRVEIARTDEVVHAPPAPFAKERIPGLVDDLESDDVTVRRVAMELLVRYVRPESPPLETIGPAGIPPNPGPAVLPFRAPETEFAAWRRDFAAELMRRGPDTYGRTIEALLDDDQHTDFGYARAMTDALRSDDPTISRFALQLAFEQFFQSTFGDEFLLDAARPDIQVTWETRLVVASWREWWHRHGTRVRWDDWTRDWSPAWK